MDTSAEKSASLIEYPDPSRYRRIGMHVETYDLLKNEAEKYHMSMSSFASMSIIHFINNHLDRE